jgi:Family of unknown function (DUF5947)
VTGPGLRRFVRPPGAGTELGGDAAPDVSPPRPAVPGPAVPGPAIPRPAAREGAGADGAPTEACEMCGTAIPGHHGHVADLERSALLCACRPCQLLFTHAQAGGGRYRAVPDRYLSDPGHPVPAAAWAELQIPVGLAFFVHSSARGQVAGFYPSPAGVTECRLDLGSWQRMAAGQPLLRAAEPDVEAVLMHQADGRGDAFVVPVDACYELAGRLRMHWHGFDGGDEARAAITDFLAAVRSRARPLDRGPVG